MTNQLAVFVSSRYYGFFASTDVNCGTGATAPGNSTGLDCQTGLPETTAGSTQLHNILTIGFGIIAALSVLMIVIAGLRFITAQGNPQEVGKARNTIIYAIIGLIVSIGAEAIVAYTLGGV